MQKIRTSFRLLSIVVLIGSSLIWSISRAMRSDSRSYEFTYKVNIRHIPKGTKRLELWIPAPQQDARQAVSQLELSCPYKCRLITDSEYGNGAYYLDITSPVPESLPVDLTFHVQRFEAGPLQSPSMKGNALKRFLLPDSLVPINGAIAREADTVTGQINGAPARARALYNHILATMRYDKSGTGWGHGDAIFACTERRGNCTDIHSLLIGMARSLGIPARFTMGFPISDTVMQGDISGYHCWVDLYIDGEGWVPVDASEAIKHPEKADYFFGNLDYDRVAFTTGRDIHLNGDIDSTTVNYFINPCVLVDGRPFSDVALRCRFRTL